MLREWIFAPTYLPRTAHCLPPHAEVHRPCDALKHPVPHPSTLRGQAALGASGGGKNQTSMLSISRVLPSQAAARSLSGSSLYEAGTASVSALRTVT
jgi:hypothetical protein